MSDSILQRVRAANAKLQSLLGHTREALAGRSTFDAADVRAISEPVRQIGPLIEQAKMLRTGNADLDAELEAYAGNLADMQKALDQMRFMLLARRAHIEAMRSHLSTLGLWSATLRMTR